MEPSDTQRRTVPPPSPDILDARPEELEDADWLVGRALAVAAFVDERLVPAVVHEGWQLALSRALETASEGAALLAPVSRLETDSRVDSPTTGPTVLKRQRRFVKAATLGTALAITFAGAAAAGVTYLRARTGETNSGWQVLAGGPGENLRKDAPDYASTLEALAADIPFAPGYGDSKKSALTTGYLAPADGGVISTGAARAQLAQDAICTWADFWVASGGRGRAADRRRATEGLAGATNWAAVRAVDPSPAPLGAEGDQGATETRFGWLPAIIAATRSGDDQVVSDAVRKSQRCDPAMTPTIGVRGR